MIHEYLLEQYGIISVMYGCILVEDVSLDIKRLIFTYWSCKPIDSEQNGIITSKFDVSKSPGKSKALLNRES